MQETGGSLDANIVAMPTTPSYAVTRLGELLLSRMERNSRSSLAEVWRAESGFSEPDTELVGHLIRHREELVLWMRAVLDDEPLGERWEQKPEVFLRGLLAPWLQERNQFLHLDELEASRELEALYRRAMEEAARVLSARADESEAANGLREVWEAHRRRLVAFAASHLGLSLHFLRHHLVDGPAAETLALAHARAFMRILTSLRPGGSFAYAPALPFVEELLPTSDYRCERVGPQAELVTSALLSRPASTRGST